MARGQALPQARRASGVKAAAVYAGVLIALALAWLALMGWLYPQATFAAAPDADTLPAWLAGLMPASAAPGASWRRLASVCHGAGLAWMLLVQGCWRVSARRVRWPLSRAVARAKVAYRVALAVILLGEAALAWLMGQAGLGRIDGFSWQAWAGCLMPLALCVPGAAALCRLAAPGFISGRYAYFRRL